VHERSDWTRQKPVSKKKSLRGRGGPQLIPLVESAEKGKTSRKRTCLEKRKGKGKGQKERRKKHLYLFLLKRKLGR